MENRIARLIPGVVTTLVSQKAYVATKYISENFVIRATRRLHRKQIPSLSNKTIDIVLTIGKPNFDAKLFIKECKKAKESFPIKKIQLKFPPKKK